MYDVVVLGAGVAGMASAARLQAKGLTTLTLEKHTRAGGCAGYYRRKGYSFDVGATTLVDFDEGGVGGELLDAIRMPSMPGEVLPAYAAHLPDREVTLYHTRYEWQIERLRAFGDTPKHRKFWRFLDRIADAFWDASRRGAQLPMRGLSDAIRNTKALGLTKLPYLRYINWTFGGALRHFGLRKDKALVGLLAMLIEDTVHSTVDDAPLINAALGVTIRDAGLSRATGGMGGFWEHFVTHYKKLGGTLKLGCEVKSVGRSPEGGFLVNTNRGAFRAKQVISSLPAPLTSRIAPERAKEKLAPFLKRDKESLGGAIVVFLGVPDEEVSDHPITHHQLMQDYDSPLGDGNNMFISVSTKGDLRSAPEGYRAVMLSTHCELSPWEGLSDEEYQFKKQEISDSLIKIARRVYPNLGKECDVKEVATPRSFQRFTGRLRGAVGGVRQKLNNSNQHAIPQELGVPGFWMAGDWTWPGLGTVACILGSRIVSEKVLKHDRRIRPRPTPLPAALASKAEVQHAI